MSNLTTLLVEGHRCSGSCDTWQCNIQGEDQGWNHDRLGGLGGGRVGGRVGGGSKHRGGGGSFF